MLTIKTRKAKPPEIRDFPVTALKSPSSINNYSASTLSSGKCTSTNLLQNGLKPVLAPSKSLRLSHGRYLSGDLQVLLKTRKKSAAHLPATWLLLFCIACPRVRLLLLSFSRDSRGIPHHNLDDVVVERENCASVCKQTISSVGAHVSSVQLWSSHSCFATRPVERGSCHFLAR